MAIQLNPAPTDTYDTKKISDLRTMVFDALGFIRPNNITSRYPRILSDLRTDLKNRLGLATPLTPSTDKLSNIRTDLYNMLGFAAMATHPPGVDTLLNAFINQAQQFLFRSIEFDSGAVTAPAILVGDNDVSVLDRDAILRLALGDAKSHYRQPDAQIYLAEAKKFLEDLVKRNPPNINAICDAALTDAERVAASRIEFSDANLGTAGAAPLYGLVAGTDTSKTLIDAEAVFLLALANMKDSLGQPDAKEIRAQYETYLANMATRQPPNAVLFVTRLIKDAQNWLYRKYEVFRMERWFTWTTIAGQRFYGTANDDDAVLLTPTGVVATIGQPNSNYGITGTLPVKVNEGSATTLTNGNILIVGGASDTGVLNSAYLYNPTNGVVTKTTGSMGTPRYYHSAVLLNDGRVLIIGGKSSFGASSNTQTAQIYDPATGLFTFTAGSMLVPRINFKAVALNDGTVLVCGGLAANGTTVLGTAEIFNPVTGMFTSTGAMVVGRVFFSATLLPSGKVLIAGGDNNVPAVVNTSEIYTPSTGLFLADGNLVAARQSHFAVLTANGNVLIGGGYSVAAIGGAAINTAEIYSPGNGVIGTFASTGNLNQARATATAYLLNNDNVLLVGGNSSGYLYSTELYNPLTAMFAASGNMLVNVGTSEVPRYNYTQMADGNIFLAGGLLVSNLASNAIQIYNVATGAFVAPGGYASGTNYYRVAALDSAGNTTLASVEISVTGVPANTSVRVAWAALTQGGVANYAIYGRATGAEQLLAIVQANQTYWIDYGTLVPNGALPTVNTTGVVNIGKTHPIIDQRMVTWFGASQGDNVWRPLIQGIDPLRYNGVTTGPPQNYEIREAIEIWPTPADSTWLLRIKGFFPPAPFEADTDINTIDWQPIYWRALADAALHYKRQDVSAKAERELADYIGRLVAGSHNTARYLPGPNRAQYVPPRPVAAP